MEEGRRDNEEIGRRKGCDGVRVLEERGRIGQGIPHFSSWLWLCFSVHVWYQHALANMLVRACKYISLDGCRNRWRGQRREVFTCDL